MTKEYLLDTNVLIEFMNGNESVRRNILRVGMVHCHFSVVSLHELYFGAYNAPKQYMRQELLQTEAIRRGFDVVQLPEDGSCYGRIKASLRRSGRLVDEFDMLIGEQAIVNGMVVVTNNVRHFKDMPDIEIEDWTQGFDG